MSALHDAKAAQEALELFGGQVEDEERQGDLGTLIAANTIALCLIAVADELRQIGEGVGGLRT